MTRTLYMASTAVRAARYGRRCAQAVLVMLLAGGAAQAGELRLQDDRGHTTRWSAPPQRIISLLPSLTETVCALGACERLVGVDRYSNFPEQVKALPQVGGLDDTSVEAVMSLRPDVVLVAHTSRIGERLQTLGLRVVAFETQSQADVQRVSMKMSELLGVADTQEMWRRINAGVDRAASKLPERARGLSVYYEVDGAPYAAGVSSFSGQILARLGARNIIPVELGPFPKISPEFVVRANPDVIMIGQRSAGGLYERPGWSRIKAIRDKRVCVFSAEQGDVLARPGPRMPEAAEIMARCLAGTNAANSPGAAR